MCILVVLCCFSSNLERQQLCKTNRRGLSEQSGLVEMPGLRRRTFMLASILWSVGLAQCQSHDKTVAIFTDKVSSPTYHTEVRPVIDQSKVIEVNIRFELASIVELNDISQSFICNGFLVFTWKDEVRGSNFKGVNKCKQERRGWIVELTTANPKDSLSDPGHES